MNRNALKDVIRLTVRDCGYGTVLTRTKLVKLVYLSDVLNLIETERLLTGIRYGNHAYGPYSDHIIETVDELDDKDVIVVPLETDRGRAYDHDPYRPVSLSERLTEEQVERVQRVLELFGDIDTTALTEYVVQRPEVVETEKYGTIIGPNTRPTERIVSPLDSGEGQD